MIILRDKLFAKKEYKETDKVRKKYDKLDKIVYGGAGAGFGALGGGLIGGSLGKSKGKSALIGGALGGAYSVGMSHLGKKLRSISSNKKPQDTTNILSPALLGMSGYGIAKDHFVKRKYTKAVDNYKNVVDKAIAGKATQHELDAIRAIHGKGEPEVFGELAKRLRNSKEAKRVGALGAAGGLGIGLGLNAYDKKKYKDLKKAYDKDVKDNKNKN